MSDDRISKVEQLAPQLYGPNCDPQILKFCNEMKTYYLNNIDNYHELFKGLMNTNSMHFKFWIIDTLTEIINQKYKSMSKATKDAFRQSLLNIFNANFEKIFNESFVTNKYCVLFNKFIFYDFPENNNTIFNDIITNIYNTNEETQKLSKLNLLLQIFYHFNEEYIQFRHTYNEIQITRSNIIKDYMRANTIQNLLIIIKEILKNEEYISNEKIIKKSIIIISQLIDWIPFEYFYDVLNIILINLIKKHKYHKECCDVLYMIVKKGMDAKKKRDILNQMKLNDLLNNILISKKKIDINTLERISDIIDLIGNFIIENFEYTKDLIKNNINNNNGLDNINESFNWSCNELRYYFYFFKEIINYNNSLNCKEASILCKSLDSIVIYFKSNDIILNKNIYVMDSFKEILSVIVKSLKIPQNQYLFDEDLYDLLNEDDFFNLREELSIIYKNVYNINALKEYVIDSVINCIKNLLHINNEQDMNKINVNNLNKYDIELCLHLINILQEGFRLSDFNNNNSIKNKIISIYKILFSFPFTNINNADYILLSYYDTINKGMEITINDKDAIAYIIKLYISDRGVFYNGKEFYKIRIVSYFDKFLSKIKKFNKIKIDIDFVSLSNTIKESIYKLILFIKKTKNYKILKNYTLLFHSYGIIISFVKDQQSKQNIYKDALKLFGDMIQELNYNNDGQSNEIVCELILNCFIQFIQTVGMKIDSDEIKKLFMSFFDTFIESYCNKIVNNKNSSLLLKYMNFMQRILILLGVDSLKYLEYFFHNNNFLNYTIICDYLKLLQNAINSLKKNSKVLIKRTFNTFYKYIEQFQFPKDNISEENKVLINMFLEFIKTFNSITSNIPDVLFENNGIDNLNVLNLIQFVLNIGKNFFASEQRRTTIKSIKNLCKFLKENKNFFEKQQFFGDILSLILNGLFIIYSKNSKKDAIDVSSSVEIASCHFYMGEFTSNYNNYLLKYLSQNDANQFVDIIKHVDYKKLRPSENLLQAFDHITNKLLT
jgi:hypothetical protein